jgi:hypothetical protein
MRWKRMQNLFDSKMARDLCCTATRSLGGSPYFDLDHKDWPNQPASVCVVRVPSSQSYKIKEKFHQSVLMN